MTAAELVAAGVTLAHQVPTHVRLERLRKRAAELCAAAGVQSKRRVVATVTP